MLWTEPLIAIPGDPCFDLIWQNPRVAQEFLGQQQYLVADHNSGLLRPATPDEAIEYAFGGEWDEAEEAVGSWAGQQSE